MPKQLALAGLDGTDEPASNLFFAVLPDRATAARIERLAQALRRDLGLEKPSLGVDRFHVSLFRVGDVAPLRPAVVETARLAVEQVAATTRPFDLRLDRARRFTIRRAEAPLVLVVGDGVQELLALRSGLAREMARSGWRGSVRAQYEPHLTLLYDTQKFDETAIAPIAWTVRELVLVRSLIGQGRYEFPVRVPLRGGEAG